MILVAADSFAAMIAEKRENQKKMKAGKRDENEGGDMAGQVSGEKERTIARLVNCRERGTILNDRDLHEGIWDSGERAGYQRALEDAARGLELLSQGDGPTDRQIGFTVGADYVRSLAKGKEGSNV